MGAAVCCSLFFCVASERIKVSSAVSRSNIVKFIEVGGEGVRKGNKVHPLRKNAFNRVERALAGGRNRARFCLNMVSPTALFSCLVP